MSVIQLNQQGPFESRRIKLAALRQGHQIVPNGWIDELVEYNGYWYGIKWDECSKVRSVSGMPDGVSLFRSLRDEMSIGMDYPDIGACEIYATIVFQTDIPSNRD